MSSIEFSRQSLQLRPVLRVHKTLTADLPADPHQVRPQKLRPLAFVVFGAIRTTACMPHGLSESLDRRQGLPSRLARPVNRAAILNRFPALRN
ncbi:MAG UNVERIFIED_CONTAM: hypothetical protein LVR18_27425 [Planctomycetaceae bacterium]